MEYQLDAWEGGTLVSPAKADLSTGIVTPAVYEGNTPITPERLEIMNQGIKKLYEEGAISKDIYIGPEEEASEEAKIIIDSNQMATPVNIEQMVDNKLLTETQQNITTDSEPVKCGYKIDNKDVYVKRITFGTLPNDAFSDISTGLSNVTVIDVTGRAYNNTNGLMLCLPYLYSGVGVSMQIRDYGSTLRVLCTSDNSAYIGYFNLYFTYDEEV